jgi:hypothetical protein
MSAGTGALGPVHSVGRRCAVCRVEASTTRRFNTRDLVAINASRCADGRTNFELPEGPCFKCDGCRNALDAVLPLLDAQPEIADYSPAKKARQSRGVSGDVVGDCLASPGGSSGSRDSMWGFSRQDVSTIKGSITTLIKRHDGRRTDQDEPMTRTSRPGRADDEQRRADDEQRRADDEQRTSARVREKVALEEEPFEEEQRRVERAVERAIPFLFEVGAVVQVNPITGLGIRFRELHHRATIKTCRFDETRGRVYDLSLPGSRQVEKNVSELMPEGRAWPLTFSKSRDDPPLTNSNKRPRRRAAM